MPEDLEFVIGGGTGAGVPPPPLWLKQPAAENFPQPRTVQLNLAHFELHFSVHSDFGSEGFLKSLDLMLHFLAGCSGRRPFE